MNHPTLSSAPAAIALAASHIAQQQLGQKEEPKGSNSGPMVDKYLASVGLNPGYAWCQAFVYWCYQQAAEATKTKNPMVKTAGVLNCWNRTKKQTSTAIVISKEELLAKGIKPQAGDQLILLFGNGTGHTGIVTAVTGTQQSLCMQTVEGNSNGAGGREGYVVISRKRKITEAAIKGIIRYL